MLFSKTQRSLHETTLELDDGLLEEASLFPLFDDRGQTRSLMLVSAGSSEIYLFDWTPEVFTRRMMAPDRLAVSLSDLRDAGDDEADAVAQLWHWDPWWVLMEERFAGHPAVPSLRGTNIPGFDDSWTGARFHRRLSQLAWLETGKGEHVKMHRFKPKKLASARTQRAEEVPAPRSGSSTKPRSSGWRLRDFGV